MHPVREVQVGLRPTHQCSRDEGVEVLQEVGDAASPVVGDEVVVGRGELVPVELHTGLFAVARGDVSEAEIDDAPNHGRGHKTKAPMDAAAAIDDFTRVFQ